MVALSLPEDCVTPVEPKEPVKTLLSNMSCNTSVRAAMVGAAKVGSMVTLTAPLAAPSLPALSVCLAVKL